MAERKSYTVVLSKTCIMASLWTFLYWFSFIITYLYNAYFWDNGIAKNLVFSVFAFWFFGIFVVFMPVLFSTVAKSNGVVLLGTGAAVALVCIIGMLPKAGMYSPAHLLNSATLLSCAADSSEYAKAVLTTVILSACALSAAIPIFNKKEI